MYLNADIPQFECWIRGEYLYDQRSHFGTFERAVVFGVASIPGQAIQFHCLLESGAQIARMPISAFVHKKDAPLLPLDYLELWDAYSYNVGVHAFSWLKSMRCRVFLKDGSACKGTYMFTIDWAESPAAESVGRIGHKNAHVIQLDNGCYAAQPNNRILWQEPSSIKHGPIRRPHYMTNAHVWHAETGTQWINSPTQTVKARSKITSVHKTPPESQSA